MIAECTNCGRSKKIKAKNLCQTCYDKTIRPLAECKRCGKTKPIRTKGYCAACAETVRVQNSSETTNKVREYHKEYRKRPESVAKEKARSIKRGADPNYVAKAKRAEFLYRLSRYGLTEEFYLQECAKGCAICGSFESLQIDHNHTTAKYRGILCAKCNKSLGLLNDNIESLQKAVIYLQTTN